MSASTVKSLDINESVNVLVESDPEDWIDITCIHDTEQKYLNPRLRTIRTAPRNPEEEDDR